MDSRLDDRGEFSAGNDGFSDVRGRGWRGREAWWFALIGPGSAGPWRRRGGWAEKCLICVPDFGGHVRRGRRDGGGPAPFRALEFDGIAVVMSVAANRWWRGGRARA